MTTIAERRLGRLRAVLPQAIAKELRIQTQAIADYLKRDRMTGGTSPTKLAVRSGRLRASVRPSPVEVKRGRIEAGVQVGTVYGPPHFGKRGTFKEIKPKTKKFLTIPLDAAKTRSGVARGSALSGMWGETFFKRDVGSDGKERLILFGKRVSQRGKFAGSARGKIIPLFLLVKSVKIPARIDPEEILRMWRPQIIASVQRLIAKTAGGEA